MDEKITKKLLKKGYKKEGYIVHIQEYDPYLVGEKTVPFRRLTYDLGSKFEDEHAAVIKSLSDAINKNFPNIKMIVTGGGYVLYDNNIPEKQTK